MWVYLERTKRLDVEILKSKMTAFGFWKSVETNELWIFSNKMSFWNPCHTRISTYVTWIFIVVSALMCAYTLQLTNITRVADYKFLTFQSTMVYIPRSSFFISRSSQLLLVSDSLLFTSHSLHFNTHYCLLLTHSLALILNCSLDHTPHSSLHQRTEFSDRKDV